MVMEDADPPEEDEEGGLTSREPSVEDLTELCRELNAQGARYLVVGGFAIRGAGYLRNTMDLDLLIDTSLPNEAKVCAALRILPDRAIDELDPGDVAKFNVVRVGDEITVDLMASACGIDYEEAAKDLVIRRVKDVDIPFASPRLLWRMKKSTHREKDALDLVFLRRYFAERGETPPE